MIKTADQAKTKTIKVQKKSIYFGKQNYLHLTVSLSFQELTNLLQYFYDEGLFNLLVLLPTDTDGIMQQFFFPTPEFMDWELISGNSFKFVFELNDQEKNHVPIKDGKVAPFYYTPKYQMNHALKTFGLEKPESELLKINYGKILYSEERKHLRNFIVEFEDDKLSIKEIDDSGTKTLQEYSDEKIRKNPIRNSFRFLFRELVNIFGEKSEINACEPSGELDIETKKGFIKFSCLSVNQVK